mmetsp:Transcript_22932/g.35332  ORF Transcript_22932/g.35332 Transcript_22932/m.35332 type:complete len:211 (+) Transcript_22932:208-840(+)
MQRCQLQLLRMCREACSEARSSHQSDSEQVLLLVEFLVQQIISLSLLRSAAQPKPRQLRLALLPTRRSPLVKMYLDLMHLSLGLSLEVNLLQPRAPTCSEASQQEKVAPACLEMLQELSLQLKVVNLCLETQPDSELQSQLKEDRFSAELQSLLMVVYSEVPLNLLREARSSETQSPLKEEDYLETSLRLSLQLQLEASSTNLRTFSGQM